MNMDERKRDMEGMRKNGASLQAIGDKHGITRERVRQILGNQGWLSLEIRKKKQGEFIKEFKEKSNKFLSNRLGVSEKKITLIRQRHGIKVHHDFSNEQTPAAIGEKAELFFSKVLYLEKIENTLMPPGHPFDILTKNGCKIDVKTTTTASNKTNPRITSPQWRFGVSKEDKEKCDYFALVLPSKEFFVIPADRTPCSVAFCWPSKRPELFKWDDCYMNLEHIRIFAAPN